MNALFEPKSIAVIGASNDPSKWGHRILRSIVEGGYKGRIYPVNPRMSSILGMDAFPDLSSIADEIDLAIVCTPAERTLKVVGECARKKVKYAILIPAGFSETGEEGRRAEQELVRAAGSCRLVGPNSMGIMSAPVGLYAYMSLARPRPGPVAFISQSGNLGTQILGRGQRQGIGFSRFVSSGNEADLTMADYLSFLASDEMTGVILSYIEGFKDGRSFLESAKAVTSRKPLVVFKAGKTPAGAKAARSHCGAMASQDEICEGAFVQAGIIRVRNTEELIDMAKAFSYLPLPRGKRVTILSWGGGWGVVGADACYETGFELAPLEQSVLEKLDGLLPSYWSRGNPVDLVGSLDLESHLECLEVLVASRNTDIILALGTISGFPEFKEHDEKFLRRTLELIREYRKPIVLVKMFEGYESELMSAHEALVFASPERAISALWKMYMFSQYVERINKPLARVDNLLDRVPNGARIVKHEP